MADLRREYDEFKDRYSSKDAVLENLDEIIETYDVSSETSLKVPFLTACFDYIAPNREWQNLVEAREDYADWWNPQKAAATALKMVMNRQTGWPIHKALLDFEWKYLVGIFFAVKMRQEEVSWSEDHFPHTLPPGLDKELYYTELEARRPPELEFSTLFSFSDTVKNDATALLDQRDIDSRHGEHHLVYLIDCTPPLEDEREEVTDIRQYVQAKQLGNYPISNRREEAALWLNESKPLIYVGSTHEFPARMRKHFRGKSSGAAEFLNLYKPQQLLDLDEHDSDPEAESAEVTKASMLRLKTDCFVFQN